MKNQTLTYWSGAALITAVATLGSTIPATAQEDVDPPAQTDEVAADEATPSGEARRRGGRAVDGERDRPRGGRGGGFGRRGNDDPSPGDRPGPGPAGRGPMGPQGAPVDAGRLFDLFDIDEDDQLSRDEFRRMTEAARIFRQMAMAGRGPGAGRGMQGSRGEFGQRGPGFERPEGPDGRGPRRGPPGGERPPRRGDPSDS